MKTPKNQIPAVALPTTIVCLALALLVSAAPPAGKDPLNTLPDSPLVVVSIGNPGRAMANALAFTRKAGLTEVETALAKVLAALEGREDLPDQLVNIAAGIDWSRRLVLAVYPPESEAQSNPGLLAYIPARKPQSLRQDILAALEGQGEQATTSLALSGYVLVALGMDAPTELDYRHTDASVLAGYPLSSVAGWVNVEAGKEFASLFTQELSSIFSSSASKLENLSWEKDQGQAREEDQSWEMDLDWEADQAKADEQAKEDSQAQEDTEAWDEEWDGDWDWDSEDWENEEPALDTQASEAAAEDTDLAAEDSELQPESTESDLALESGLPVGQDSLDSLMDNAEGMLKGLADIFKDIRAVDFGLIIENDRAWLHTGTSIAPGGVLYQMSTEAASGQQSLPYLPYLELDSLVSMAWSTKADWAIKLLEILYETMLPDETLLRKSLTAMKASMAATGSNGAMSFDVQLSNELASAIRDTEFSGQKAVPLISRGLRIDATGVFQLTNRQGFRDAMTESMALMDDPAYRALLKTSQVEVKTRRTVGILDGMPYDKYEYEIGGTEDGDIPGEALEMLTAIAGPLLKPVYVYRGDKAYLGFGNPESVRALIGRDRATNPLQNAPRFRALRGGAPADVRAIAYLSTGTLMRRIMQILPEGKSILSFGYGDLYGILSWFSASPGDLGFGFGLGAEDIKAFRSLPD